jgi:hypothetical protein
VEEDVVTKPYQPPTVKALGTVEELTEQASNKVGPDADIYTALTGGAVVGSLVPAPD